MGKDTNRPTGSLARAWRMLAPLMWTHRRTLGFGMAALAMKDLLAAVAPLAIRAAVDAIADGFDWGRVGWFAAAMVALTCVKGIFQYWMRTLIIGVSRDIEYGLRQKLFAHLMRLDSGFYGSNRIGDLMARATNDLNAVRMMLGPGVMYTTETGLTLVLVSAILFWVDWRLTLVALAPAPLVSIAVVFFGQRIHGRFQKIQALFSDISSRVQESLAGVRVVRAYTQEEAEVGRFEELNRNYIHQNLRLTLLQGLFMPVLEALIAASFLIVLWVGGQRLLAREITLGTFLMFNVCMGMLAWPMIALGWVVNLVQRGTASLARIEEILSHQPSIAAPPDAVALPETLTGEIVFDCATVEFAGRRALDGISLRIPAGSTAAIVGHTGSGKTTLVNLVPRLVDTTMGSVRVDGIDVRRTDPEALRRHIAFVPQETFLFSATLGENIAFGVEGATREMIQRAAGQAGLGPDLASFPLGLDTIVGERGITLSGGQKQRTAIARALLRNPSILILDDALASVDTVTEERILGELAVIMGGRTSILISHRVSTVRAAGRIFVLNQGRLAEEGTHDELIARGGYYAELHERQMLEEELGAV
jgi:ATP-binding cassette, subfamily B, multidrug efflux pump